ncbi:MAG TPA: transcription termination/antitermination NusG family protein [Thermoanaerobaculia bacterium]|nr:transcription termination/antitermination NusG family protein [Thermoanaerobaculia bacterium]
MSTSAVRQDLSSLAESSAALSPWLLVHTKPLQEALAEHALVERGLPVYCPRVIEPPSHVRAPRGPVPLFRSYVFCRAVPEEGFAAITYCPGVDRLVRFGDAFATLRDEDVDFLTEREDGRGYLVIPPRPIHLGDPVRVLSGPFGGFEAVVERLLPSSERVRLLLRVASGTWRAIVPIREVRPLGNGKGKG